MSIDEHILKMTESIGEYGAKLDSLHKGQEEIFKSISSLEAKVDVKHKELHEKIAITDAKTQSLIDDKKKFFWTTMGISVGAGIGSANMGKVFTFLASLIGSR